MIKTKSKVEHHLLYNYYFIFLFRILYNIMANEFVNGDYKGRLRNAARIGRDDGTCKMTYHCSDLDKF